MERFLAVLPEPPQPLWIRYSVTTIIILLCSLVQYGMYQLAGFSGFFVIIPGIFLCGFLFDRGSAFLATFIGVIFSVYLLPPLEEGVRQFVPLVIFGFVGFLCAIVSEGVRKILERMEKGAGGKGTPAQRVEPPHQEQPDEYCILAQSAGARCERSVGQRRSEGGRVTRDGDGGRA